MHTTPYATPRTKVDERLLDPPTPRLTKAARTALFLILAPVLSLGAVLLFQKMPRDMVTMVLGAGAALAVVGVFVGGWSWWRLARIDRAIRPSGLAASVTATLLGPVTAAGGALVTLISMISFTRGRQLRKNGRLMFAPVSSDGDVWLGEAQEGEAAPDRVAAVWRENGLTEHASVAAFARLSMELMALGAPPSLIQAAHEDALDEMRHTELCFSLARDLDGQAIGPSAFPSVSSLSASRGPRTLSLAYLAVNSLIDGALNEGVSARVVAELAKEVEEPRVQAVLAAIAKDEARHAAHGFDVVRWCLETGGAPVASALRGALRHLPEQPPEHAGSMEGGEEWGIPSQDRIDRCFGIVRTKLVQRTERMLDAC